MKTKLRPFLSLAIAITLGACGSDSTDADTPTTNKTTNGVEKLVTINAGETYQTITGFGASDCWCPSYVGKYWTSSREKIAKLLFSTEMQSGQPQGIGLSMWRVNLGGGTMEQGDDSGIADKSRRAESYLTDDLTLDWIRCEGQRYFLDRAKAMGVPRIVLFSNTPPVQYTKNGLGMSESGSSSNLKDDCYDDFAAYMADVAQYYLGQGYPVTHISPVNEPQYNWDTTSNQEGTGWTNAQVAQLVRELDTALSERNLDVDIAPGEAGDWEYLYKTKSDANRSNVIHAFYSSDSSSYIGDLSHVNNLVSGHSYWTDGTWSGMRSVRELLAQAAESYGVEVWQSEWSMLGDDYSTSEYVGHDNATEMDIALYMSKVIHNDLTVGGVTSWCYWTSMDVIRYGHKDRFLLISLVPGGGVDDNNSYIEQEGTYTAMPTLWVLGNYSRFIRPGYQRIALTLNESRSFFGSGWRSADKKQIVAVYTNLSDSAVSLVETHEGWSGSVQSVTTYTTSVYKNLEATTYAADDTVVLDAESVTTVVYNLN